MNILLIKKYSHFMFNITFSYIEYEGLNTSTIKYYYYYYYYFTSINFLMPHISTNIGHSWPPK